MTTQPPCWHQESAAQALKIQASRRDGLDAEMVQERRNRFGPNRLTPPKKKGPLMRFLLQFHNVLIYVLLVAAGVTAALGEWVDTGVILGVVLINGLIGFIQEGKAEKSLDAIRNLLSLHATVLRSGQRLEIAAEDLVPGDIVLLSPGDKVPADLRLIETRNLRIEEAALTGESEPVEKNPEPVAAEAAIGDRTCMAYSGTLVVFGQGRGLVVGTADQTEIGRIGRMLANVEDISTPLLKQTARFGQGLTLAIMALTVFSLVFGIAVHGYGAAQMFLAAVGIAVAAVPEGLPAVMTITLAIGVQRMAARQAIIRRMPAVETLGAVTVICTDKTGTLTKNEMTVQRLVTADRVLDVEGIGYTPRGGFSCAGRELRLEELPELAEIGRIALLCNDATLEKKNGKWVLQGDPTEGALLTLGRKTGLEPHFEAEASPRIDVIPFESQHRFMATLHHDHAGHAFAFIKGAPEEILTVCTRQRQAGQDQALDAAFWQAQIEAMAQAGQRVLALAMTPMPPEKTHLTFADLQTDLTLVALAGIMDPPREEAIAAVAQCQAAGIRVKMITGDHSVTAQAVGKIMGIGSNDRTLTGTEIETLDDEAICLAVRDTDVFARASPEHKLRLVQAMQANGEVVSMTGDGVNDAPALKQADVGVAMGLKGTEAAKEAAEMVLANDNFASIAAAVEEGRTVYDNLRKAIIYILPTSSGQAAMVLIAVLLGMTLPITPVQILWVNMVTAITLSMAFAFERPEANIMKRPPRNPTEPLVNGFMLWRIGFVTLLMVLVSFGLFLWEQNQGASVEVSRTVAVNALVVAEMFYLFNCRSLQGSILNREGFFGNTLALQAIGGLFLLQLAFTYLPLMQEMFHTAAIDAAAWLRIFVAGVLLLLIVEGEKALFGQLGKNQQEKNQRT
ncbi:MAG: cation-transporting P-type ATPase [Azovibrio sp.]|uniref:cation-transporting P-type ATPase n=1 Tax=Azovibrio sp. TaxID=1872673 RepID=UPI003C770771